MEIGELQKGWKELNNKVLQDDMVCEEEIRRILVNRKESHLQKFLRHEKSNFIVLVGVNLLILYFYINYREDYPIYGVWITAFAAGLFNLIMSYISQYNLRTIIKETNLEKQIQNILKYRLFKNKYTIAAYLSIIPYIICFLYYSGYSFLSYLLLGSILLIISIVDFFSFRYFTNLIKDLIYLNKDLSEFNTEKMDKDD